MLVVAVALIDVDGRVLIAQRPSLSEEPLSEHRSRFVIEPLESGFGYTLGNSLRRTLLSSIPGASVTSIKVDSVLHEFSTIDGVKEDVTEVRDGFECGINLGSFNDVREGDLITTYEMREKPRA